MATAAAQRIDGVPISNFVNGSPRAASGESGAAIFNPATGQSSGWLDFSSPDLRSNNSSAVIFELFVKFISSSALFPAVILPK